MLELGYIAQDEHDAARDAPVTARVHGLAIEVEAPYLAEMVRARMEETYGPDVYTAGYKVWTTADARLQHAANAALRQALQEYDGRHGFRKPERHVATGDGDSRRRACSRTFRRSAGSCRPWSRRSMRAPSPPGRGTRVRWRSSSRA